jgi:hypothetical protein
MTAGNNPTTDRSKLGTKRHILTDKQGIPLSAVISSPKPLYTFEYTRSRNNSVCSYIFAKTHDIKLVTDNVVDNVVIRRRQPSSSYRNGGRRIRRDNSISMS